MSSAAMKRVVAIAGILIVAAASGVSTVQAGKDPGCVGACRRQYDQDKRVCDAAYRAQAGIIDQQRQCCRSTACRRQNYPGWTQSHCLADADRKTVVNVARWVACKARALSTYVHCIAGCPRQTPYAP
jgi:protein tyrosine phosphatase